MPKKNVTSKAACKAPSPAEETHPETSLGAMDVAKLMAVITNSEQTVLARIDTMDKKVDSNAAQYARITSLEDATNAYSDRVVDLQSQVLQLKEEVTQA